MVYIEVLNRDRAIKKALQWLCWEMDQYCFLVPRCSLIYAFCMRAAKLTKLR